MFQFSNDQIYKRLDTIISTTRLKYIYDDLISECWKDMEPMLKERSYIHCYLFYTNPDFTPDKISSKHTLRKMYNDIRGWNDEDDEGEFREQGWAKVWTYETGWMMYYYAGPENCRSGDDKSFQNIYKFIPNLKTLKKYQSEIDSFRNQVKDELGARVCQLMFTKIPVGSGIDWHVDTGLVGRFHSVIENDGTTPSMTFKQNGEIKHIPAVEGETYYANINVPHYVPESNSTRLHLLGCVDGWDWRTQPKEKDRHQDLGASDQTWAEWKKDLGVE